MTYEAELRTKVSALELENSELRAELLALVRELQGHTVPITTSQELLIRQTLVS